MLCIHLINCNFQNTSLSSVFFSVVMMGFSLFPEDHSKQYNGIYLYRQTAVLLFFRGNSIWVTLLGLFYFNALIGALFVVFT